MAFILVLSLFFFTILYKSEIRYSGIYRQYYIIYLVALAVQIFFGIILLFLKNEIKKNLILFYFSLIFSILVIEISLNYILKKNKLSENSLNKIRLDYLSQKGIEVDRRNIYQVYSDLIEKNRKAVPVVPPQSFEDLYTFGSISKSLTISCNENGNWPLYTSDNYGFRNPDQIKPGNVKIAFIGDSFTWGACVETEDAIAGQIRSKSKLKTINYGVPDSGPLIQLGILNEYVKFDKPETVFYLYYEGNDLSNLRSEKENKLLIKYLDINFSQNLKSKQSEIDMILNKEINKRIENKDKNKKKFKEDNIIKLLKDNLKFKNIRSLLGIDNFDGYKQVDPIYQKILFKLKNDVEAWGGNFYFVYLPSAKHYNIFYNNKKLKYEKVINIVKSLDIQLIDLHEKIFVKEKNPMKFFPAEVYGHYNKEGYSLVSQLLLKYIKYD